MILPEKSFIVSIPNILIKKMWWHKKQELQSIIWTHDISMRLNVTRETERKRIEKNWKS